MDAERHKSCPKLKNKSKAAQNLPQKDTKTNLKSTEAKNSNDKPKMFESCRKILESDEDLKVSFDFALVGMECIEWAKQNGENEVYKLYHFWVSNIRCDILIFADLSRGSVPNESTLPGKSDFFP